MSQSGIYQKQIRYISAITMLLCVLLILTSCALLPKQTFQTVGKSREEIEQMMLVYLEEKYEEKFVMAHSNMMGRVTQRHFEFLCYPEGKIENNFRAYLNDYNDGEPVVMKDEYFGYLIRDDYEAYMVEVMEELGFEEPKAVMASMNNIYPEFYDNTKGFQDILNDEKEYDLACNVYLKQEIPDLKELEEVVRKIPNMLACDGLKWGGGEIRFVTEEYYTNNLRQIIPKEKWDNLYVDVSIALRAESFSTIEIIDYRETPKKVIRLKVETGEEKNDIDK